MTLRVESVMVQRFGNSVVFGDKLDQLPMMFQPLLFYPDWFLMTWPINLFLALFGNNTDPVLTNMGASAIGWSIVWFLFGLILGACGMSNTFTEWSTPRRFPASKDFIHKAHCSGLFGQLLVLPLVLINVIYTAAFKFVAYLLFWHIVIARVIGLFLTPRDWLGDKLSAIVRGIVYVAMLAPPILVLLASITLIVLRIVLGEF